MPFGFIGDFTDNRSVLLVSENGGEIVKTKKYKTRDNTQITTGEIDVLNNGSIHVNIEVKSAGIQYNNKYRNEAKSKKDLKKYYLYIRKH